MISIKGMNSPLQYTYSDHTLELLRPILYPNNISHSTINDKKVEEPWQKILSQLTTEEIKYDVALCLLAEALDDSNAVSLDTALDACGPGACIVASATILSDIGGSVTATRGANLVAALPLVLRTIRRQYLTKPADHADAKSHFERQTYKHDSEFISQILLRLPVLISNACLVQKLQLPAWSIRSNFLTRLIQCCTAHRSVLVRRLVHMGASDLIARAIGDSVHSCWSAIPTSRDRLKLLQSIVRCVVQEKTSLIGHWKDVCEAQVHPSLCERCLPPLMESSELARQLCKTMLLSNPTSGTPRFNRILSHALALLFSECGVSQGGDEEDSMDDEEENFTGLSPVLLLHEALNDMVSIWNERRFVQKIPVLTQRRVTYFLQSSIPMFDCLTTSSQISTSLIRGVSVRLESSLHDVRVDGMRIAQLLANQLGGAVHFDEVNEEDYDDEIQESLAAGEEPSSTTTSNQQRRRYRDPDADYHSSDSEKENTDSDDDSLQWDNELVPLDQGDDDEEDLRETPKPHYLRECLELLQTPESHPHAASRHRTALEFLPKLVESRPLDLPDVALPLAQQLFRLEDKFGMDDFDETLRVCVVSLAVSEAVSVGDYVIGYIFDDVSLYSRMLGLYTLECAARKLSGSNELENGARSLSNLALDARVSGNHRLVPDGKSSTRRWGHLNHPNHQTTVTNRFLAVAPRWFYSLIGKFMDHKEDVKLWGGANGARLLAHLLVALSTMVDACSITSTTMSRDLLQFSWTFRTSDDSTLRSAVLVAIASSLASCGDAAILMQTLQYAGGDMDLPSYLANVIHTDSDDVSRTLAQTISKNVLSILQQRSNNLLR